MIRITDAKKQQIKSDKQEEKHSTKKEVFSWIRMFIIVIAVVLILTQLIIINARIPSGSMENTIMTHDRLIGFRFAYWFDEPERGDIILFQYPVDEKQIYIKRVIGLPGETVEINNGRIYIDGSDEPLQENYLKETWTRGNDGYSDLVVMSSELYDKFARINRIDQAIFESEKEVANGAEAVDAEKVFAELDKKHFG